MAGQLVVDLSSNNQHPIPWAALKAAGVQAAIVKVTEGVDYVNPDAAGDLAEAAANGLGRAVYLFFHPGSEPAAQWGHALEQTPPGISVVWVDAEVTDGFTMAQVAPRVQACLAAAQPGQPEAGLYENLSWLADSPGAPWGHPLWLADPSHPDTPALPCLLHQFGQQTIDGQSFDMSRFQGSDELFAAMFPGASTAAAPAPAPPAPAPAPADTGTVTVNVRTLTEGDSGDDVKTLQAILAGKWNQPAKVDGQFGAVTAGAVRMVQAFLKLSIDGEVGPITWNALVNA